MNLPTAKEINPYDDLDGRLAEKHFLGKTVDEATELFKENSMAYQEDLMWMGPVAFEFYLQAVFNYVSSDFSKDDFHFIYCLANTFKNLLESKVAVLESTLPLINKIVAYALNNIVKFIEDEQDTQLWQNEVKQKLIHIQNIINKLD